MFSPAGKHLFTPEPAPWAPREWRAVAVDTSQPARFSREKTDKLECFGQKEVRKKRHRKKNITFVNFVNFNSTNQKGCFFFWTGIQISRIRNGPRSPWIYTWSGHCLQPRKISRLYQSSLSILSCLSDLRRVTGGFICGNVSLHMLVGDWAYWQ